jgi:hypothetical protein
MMNITTSANNDTYQYATFHRGGKSKVVRVWLYSRYGVGSGEDWGEYYVTNPDDEDMADGWCAFDGEIGPITL